MRRKSLELIIFIPVFVFLILASTGLYLMIWTSVKTYAESSIRNNLSAMSNAMYRILDYPISVYITDFTFCAQP